MKQESSGRQFEADCRNAKEFAREWLQEAEGFVKPYELADEYECTKQHMQETLRELVQDGDAKRVGYGRYVAVSPEEDGGEDGEETEPVELVECPYEGCEYETDSVEGLRAHSNATNRHDWEDISAEIAEVPEEESEEPEEPEESEAPPLVPLPSTFVWVAVVVVVLVVVFSVYRSRSSSPSAAARTEEEERSTGLVR